jgi:AraC family transcriptional regulator
MTRRKSSSIAQRGGFMGASVSSHQATKLSLLEVSRGELPSHQSSTLEVHPPEMVRRRLADWASVQSETLQVLRRKPFDTSFKQNRHMLIAFDQGVRYDGETGVEGFPASTLRNYAHKMIFVPAGARFRSWQHPQRLARQAIVYIEPHAVHVDPDLRFAEADVRPRVMFEDDAIWQTVQKLKSLISSENPGNRIYAEALGGLLAQEILRLDRGISAPRTARRGGLAGWQQTRVRDFIEEHIELDVSLKELADLAKLSPYHFLRSFKQSFGEAPHRYWADRRIERAKTLLANSRLSVTEIALNIGFSTPSAFSNAFHRITGRTPTDYRRESA